MLAGASPFPGIGERDADLLRDSGLSALLLTVLATAVPTLRQRLGLPWLLRLRQPIGALAFAYALAHGLLAMRAAGGSRVSELLRAAVEEPAQLAGLASFALALPLLATSNRLALRWLSAPVWQDVQRSLGIVAALATAHAIGLVTATPRLIIVLLAAAALVWIAFAAARSLRDRLRQPATPPAAPGGQVLRFYRRRPPR
ncbi:MAG TPA: ferric reductase-like transmembrane domain-containing protein [Rhodocyclaceae bacterium]